jgi:hypothetical protein
MKAKSAIIAAALLGPNPKQRLLLARDWATVRKWSAFAAMTSNPDGTAADQRGPLGRVPARSVPGQAGCVTRGLGTPM